MLSYTSGNQDKATRMFMIHRYDVFILPSGEVNMPDKLLWWSSRSSKHDLAAILETQDYVFTSGSVLPTNFGSCRSSTASAMFSLRYSCASIPYLLLSFSCLST